MKRFFSALWDSLTRPSPAISDPQGQLEAQLLASLLLMFAPLWLLAPLVSCVAGRCGLWQSARLLIVAIAVWTLTYGLVRSRHYRLGTLLSSGIAVILIPVMALQTESGLVLGYLLLPVLFSGLLFSMRTTHLVAGGCLAMLFLLHLLMPERFTSVQVATAGTLVATGSALVLLLVRHRNHSEALRRKELAEQEARYRAIVADQTELIWRIRPDLTLTFVNDALCRFLNLPREELVGRPLGGWLYEEDRQAALRQLAALGPTTPTLECAVRAARADGEVRRLHCVHRAIQDSTGAVVEMQSVARDVTDRVQAEAALRDSERRFRSIFEQAPVGVYRTAPDGRILIANPAIIELLGYESFEALATRNLATEGFGAATPRDGFRAQIEADGAVQSVESEWLRRDGRRIVVRETARLITDEEGRPRYYEGVAIDVTAERDAEAQIVQQAEFLATLNTITHAALEATELGDVLQVIADRLREAFDADSCYITLWDEARHQTVPMVASGEWRGRYRNEQIRPEGPTLTASVLAADRALAIEDNRNTPYLNPQIAEIYPDRSLLGLPLITGEQKLGAALLGFVEQRGFSEEEVARGEQIASHIALAVRNAMLYQEVRRYANELEARVAKRTAELSFERAQLQAVLDSTVEGIVMTDRDGEIARANRAAQAWLTQTLPREEARKLQEAVHAIVVSPNRRASRSLSLRGVDLQLSSAPVVAETQPDAVVVSIYDVTHLKAMDRLRAAFVQNVSHEMRTPVATLRLYTHLLPTATGQRREAYERAIETEVNRLSRLVEDVVVLSTLDTGGLTLSFEAVNLRQVITGCCSTAAPLAEQARLTLDADAVSSLPCAWADPIQLAEAISQILRNAIAYTPPGGRVTVSTALRQAEGREWVTVSIRDTGMGIAEEELPRLFERFSRGTMAIEAQIIGTGLGLAITKALIDLHDGRITVESTLGEGATFTIWLAQAADNATAA